MLQIVRANALKFEQYRTSFLPHPNNKTIQYNISSQRSSTENDLISSVKDEIDKPLFIAVPLIDKILPNKLPLLFLLYIFENEKWSFPQMGEDFPSRKFLHANLHGFVASRKFLHANLHGLVASRKFLHANLHGLVASRKFLHANLHGFVASRKLSLQNHGDLSQTGKFLHENLHGLVASRKFIPENFGNQLQAGNCFSQIAGMSRKPEMEFAKRTWTCCKPEILSCKFV